MKDFIVALIALLVLNWVLLFMTRDFILTNEVVETAISGNYNESHIEEWRSINVFFDAYAYGKMPIRTLSHLLFISFIIYAFLIVRTRKIVLTGLLHSVTLSLFVYTLPLLLRLIQFGLINTNFTYQELFDFKPLNFAYWQGGFEGMHYKAKAFYSSFELTDILFVILASILITKRVYAKPVYVSICVIISTAALIALNYAYYAL